MKHRTDRHTRYVLLFGNSVWISEEYLQNNSEQEISISGTSLPTSKECLKKLQKGISSSTGDIPIYALIWQESKPTNRLTEKQ